MAWCARRRRRSSIVPLYCSQIRVSRRYVPYLEPGGASVPEQEFPPPRRLARPYRPDRDDDEPPPWANLPPVGPARSGRPPGPGRSPGPERPGGPTTPIDPAIHSVPNSGSGDFSNPGLRAGRSGSHRVSDPVQDEPVPQWAQWDEPEDDAGEAAPAPRTREPGGRALRAAARRRRRWYYLGGGAVVVVGAVLAVVLLDRKSVV